MRLIDADKIDFSEVFIGNSDFAKDMRAGAKELIDKQPTAFDLESVIAEIEKKRDCCYVEMKKEEKETDYFSEHIFEEYHNQGKAYNDCLEILNSAANATNGKIGG